jgi:murein DD-endopeptidase MepM/ murein hydrolase activator NlpD
VSAAMLYRFRFAVFGFAFLMVAWTGYKIHRYFFDDTVPQISMNGIDENGFYAGDISCKVASNKKGDLSVWLDGQPLISHYRLSVREHEHPFIIPSKTMNNGKHSIKIELVDASYAKHKAEIERSFYVDNTPLQAAFVRSEADYKVFQGRTLHLQFQANKEIKEAKVKVLSQEYDCFAESKNSSIYECFVPVSCEEAPNEYLLSIDMTDKVGNSLNLESKFQVVLFPFKKQTLQVSAEKVAEEKALGVDTAKLESVVDELIKQSPHEKLWRGPFVVPIDSARVTCDFGTIRTTQEKGRYAHKGLDLANMPKSVVWAPQDGIVVHKERYGFTGNTVILDHGWGMLSLFFHLDSFADIKVGQKVAKGNPIGTLGKTGYATGYHLHWEMRINNTQVDPMQWTKTNF